MKKTLILTALGVALIATSGCANLVRQDYQQRGGQSYQQRFQGCLDKLESLKSVDPSLYNQNKLALDKSMQSATQYLALRETLDDDMSNVMDSVYQARIARDCQEIDRQLFRLLLEQADGK